jgi:hypothetical protein
MADGKVGHMQDDEPTLPPRIRYVPVDAPDPDAFSEAPTWPPADERPVPPLRPDGSPLLWLIVGAIGVVITSLLGGLLLNQLGMFAPRGATGSPGPTSALSGPTALPSPTATTSLSVQVGGLKVTPSSVRLGCDGDERTQEVVLVNAGQAVVEWQAVVDTAADRAGIAITPNQGDLDAGESVSVQIENTTQSSDSGGSSHREGVIRFVPASADAGVPASFSYRLDRCH